MSFLRDYPPLLLLVPVALLCVFMLCKHRASRRFRLRFMAETARLDDAAFLAATAIDPGGDVAPVALGARLALAKSCRLPRQCIGPATPLGDLFFAAPFLFYDGVDIAALVEGLEDQSLFNLDEDTLARIPLPDDATTVAEFVEMVVAAHDKRVKRLAV